MPKFGVGATCLLVAAILTVPSPGLSLGPGVDYSWEAALTVAFRDHRQWGSQIVSTYGPYGYMNWLSFIHFDTWLLAFVINAVLHLAFFTTIGLFLWTTRSRPVYWLLLSAVFVMPLFRFPTLDFESMITAVLLLHLQASASTVGSRTVLSLAAGLLLGWMLLGKGNMLDAAFALITLSLLFSLISRRGRSAAILLGTVIASFLGFWLLAGQSLTNIPGYFRASYEMSAGYTAAMSVFWEAGARHPLLDLSLGALMLVLTASLALMAAHRHDLAILRLVTLSLPLMFLMFKEAFVRYGEERAALFWTFAIVIGALVLIQALGKLPRPNPELVCAPLLIVLASGLLLVDFAHGSAGTTLGEAKWGLAALPEKITAYRHAAGLVARPARRSQEEAQVRDNLRTLYRLDPNLADELRTSDMDVIPWDTELPIAYDLNWNPRPLVQSYQAYTPYLDHLDANHFAGANAPRFVLLSASDIDNRYPLFSEPETYRVLFERYEPRRRLQHFLLLEKRANVLLLSSKTSDDTGFIDHWIDVPSHGSDRVFAHINISYSPWGKAMNVLWRPPELHIRLRYAEGAVSPSYRFIPAVATDGVDLSSYAPDIEGMEQLIQGHLDRQIQAFQITTDSPSAAYERSIHVTYVTMTSHVSS